MSDKNVQKREEVIKLAESWQSDMEKTLTLPQGLTKKLDKLLTNPKNKIFLIELLDKSFRGQNVLRVDNQIRYIIHKYNMLNLFERSSLFNFVEKILVNMYYYFGRILPWISIPIFKEKIRIDASNFVLKEETLESFIKKNAGDGIHVNVNKIGESVIGEEEALMRLDKYEHVIEHTNIGHIAVKISTIYSQVSSIAMEHTIEVLVKRLSRLYRKAKEAYYTDRLGNRYKKWIHLDMEEYRDLEITFEVFKKTLDQEEFFKFDRAGIALQAYMPETLLWYDKLLEWAKKRVDNGGGPVKIRLVKGANMEMEMTEASIRNWELVTYTKKIDSDSNYKKILEKGLKKENARYIRFGIASHNLFDVVYAYSLIKEYGSEKYVFFEMLEGMAETLRYKLKENKQTILLYVPTASRKDFTSAVGYLVRRLDENTNKDNFMRYSFGLKVQSPEFEMLKNQFRQSFNNIHKVAVGKNRKQNRNTEKWQERKHYEIHTFINEADTDFALKENRDWIEGVIEKWKQKRNINIPLYIGKEEIKNREIVKVRDYSSKDKHEIGSYKLANKEDMKKALDIAYKDEEKWSEKELEDIYSIFSKAMNLCRERRGDLIGIAAAELGKVVTETDVEVSEAIDFLNFYSYAACKNQVQSLKMKPRGVVVVIAPWNFPIAIPVGGIAAALAVGNRVIFKASSDSTLCGYEVCKLFWDAGVSKEVLQYIPSKGSDFGEYICKDKRVEDIILTGGEETAYKILESRWDVRLSAETGGKNAMILGSICDVDLALIHVITSAFSNSGQKCSACSLLLVPNDLYYDKNFEYKIRDAVKSLDVGSQWDLKNKISRLVRIPKGPLKQAIETIESHERWIVEPSIEENNEYMVKPMVRIGTRRGDFTHKTELFGPHLTIMGYRTLKEAIDIVHETGYGLTSGIHTLDERELKEYLDRIQAGNVYINRGITGAIVMRQPFGGMGKSAIGTGRKVGYYNYTLQFQHIENIEEYYKENFEKEFHDMKMAETEFKDSLKSIYQDLRFNDKKHEKDMKKVIIAYNSYVMAKRDHFEKNHDEFHLRGEDNYLRYKSVKNVFIRIKEEDTIYSALSMIIGARLVCNKVYVSINTETEKEKFYYKILEKYQDSLKIEVLKDKEEDVLGKIFDFECIRYGNRKQIEKAVEEKLGRKGIAIRSESPLMYGRYELLNYYKEQSVSNSYHRYGNLGERGIESK